MRSCDWIDESVSFTGTLKAAPTSSLDEDYERRQSKKREQARDSLREGETAATDPVLAIDRLAKLGALDADGERLGAGEEPLRLNLEGRDE